MDEPQRRCEQRFKPDRTLGRLGKRLPLDLGILRIVCRVDHIDRARIQPLDHGLTVILGPQRRREFEERPVGCDVVLVEREVVDRNSCGDAR